MKPVKTMNNNRFSIKGGFRSWPWVALFALFALVAGCSKEAKKERYSQSAAKYYAQGDLERARIEYLNVLRLDRTNLTAVAQLGRIFHQRGAPLQAFPLLREAGKILTNDWDIAFRMASIRAGFGERDSARQDIASVLTHSPTNDEAILLLAELSDSPSETADARQRIAILRQRAGDRASLHLAESILFARDRKIDQAEKEIQSALALDPKLPAAHMGMVGLHLARTNLAAAGQEFKAAADLSPPRSNIPVRYAEFMAQQGRKDEARKYLEEIGAKTPDYLPVWSALARLAYSEKRMEDAQQLANRVLTGDPANYEARVLRASINLDQKKADRAVLELTELERAFPRLPQTKLLLARASAADQKLDQAMVYVEQALRLNTNYLEAALFKAELTMARGDSSSAIRGLQSLLLQTNNVPAQMLLAKAFRQNEQWDSAGTIFQGLAGAFPKDPQYPFLLGMMHRDARKYSEARASFEAALKLSPGNPLAIYQLVDLDILATNYPAALARVRAEMEKNPKSSAFPLLEGRIFAAQKLWPQAEASLQKTLTLSSNSPGAFELLVQVHMGAGNFNKAAATLERQLAINPEDGRALFTSALVSEQLQDFPKARDAYEKSLKLSPENVVAMNNLAYLYLERLNQPDQAAEMARKARNLAPRDPAIADTLGWILYRKGDYEAAVPLLQESAEMLSNNAEVQYHLGMAHYRRGSEDDARTALGKAVSLPADFKGKDEARTRLASLGTGAAAASPGQIAELEKAVAQHPDDLIAIVRLASAYRQGGKNDRATELYEKALKLNPKAVAPMVQLAELYAGPLNQPAKALQLAKSARALAPQDARLGHLAGRLAFDAGDHAWAYNLLYESAVKQPNDAEVQYDLAWAAYSLGRVDEAGQKMQRALQVNSKLSRAASGRWLISLLALSTNATEAAQLEASIRQLLAAEPGNVPALMVVAGLAESRGRFDEARAGYEKALQRYPSMAHAQRDLAALFADRLNDPAKAGDLAGKARQTLTADAKVARTQGKAALLKGDANTAVRYLQEATRLAAGDALAFYYLGQAHVQLKQKKEATAVLQHAVTLAPTASFVPDAKKLLDESR